MNTIIRHSHDAVEAALDYAARGWHVFPCAADKSPLTDNGFFVATTDAAIIRGWRWPFVGLRLGECSGLSGLDIDVREGVNGYDSLAALGLKPEAALMDLTPTLGGRHLYFRFLSSSNFDIAPGLQFKNNGYFIIPPGAGREWLAEGSPEPVPEWLRVLVGVRALTGYKEGTVSPSIPSNSPFEHSSLGSWKPIGPTRNIRSRTALILRWLDRTLPGERSKNFYRAVCMFAEIELEGKLKPDVSDQLLLGSAKENGLVAEYGIEACRATIKSARARVRSHYPDTDASRGDASRDGSLPRHPACTPYGADNGEPSEPSNIDV